MKVSQEYFYLEVLIERHIERWISVENEGFEKKRRTKLVDKLFQPVVCWASRDSTTLISLAQLFMETQILDSRNIHTCEQ